MLDAFYAAAERWRAAESLSSVAGRQLVDWQRQGVATRAQVEWVTQVRLEASRLLTAFLRVAEVSAREARPSTSRR